MSRNLILAWVLCAVSQLAWGFELVVRGKHATLTPAELRAMTLQIAQASGHQIPDVPQLKVVVTAQAKPREQEGRYLYYHRVQLTKVFDGGPPYPYRGWLPIKGIEAYGLATDQELKQKLAATLKKFFSELKDVDPATSAP